MNKSSIAFLDFETIEIVTGNGSHSFPLHIHRTDCYGTITKGKVALNCNGLKILNAGDSYWIPAAVPHSFTAINGEEYSYETICIRKESKNEEEQGWLQNAKAYIMGCIEKEWEIDGLPKYVHLSKYHLFRKFKKKFGLSPYQYYMNARIGKIRQGLLSGQPLSDLAYQLGFSHQSHMCNVFKR